ncbi:hypothetical protein M3Y95_00738000 [Aphelenchoides besseyi]|nr:hypothetical protein M3Y95_00738000 [Aphelenchoides besseyi]
MSSKTPRRKRDEGGGIGARASKRSKRDFFEHTTYCSELFNAIRSARGQDGRLISESLQRAPSRRQDPDYHNAIERAMDLSRINQKLNADEYNSLDEMCADIELLIENTISFYKPESVEYQHAVELKRVYEVEKEKLLQGSSRSESRTDRMSIASTGTTGSVKREPSPKPEEWRMEALLCAILDEHDSQGRLLCPPFRVLASPESFPMYYEHIQQPMDLKTVATKLRNADYATWTSFGDDLKLMYKNAKSFNETSSTIYKDAVNLHNRTVKRLQEFSSIKKPSASELNKNKQTVDNLLTQEFVSEGEEESEDSDEEAVQKADTPFAKLYSTIRQSDLCAHFVLLPEKSYYPDYYEDIQTPVSLYLINKRIKQQKYGNLAEMAADLQLMCRNAMTYNIDGSEIYENAMELDALIIKTAKELDPSLQLTPTTVEAEETSEKPTPQAGRQRQRQRNTVVSKPEPSPSPTPSDTMHSFAHKPSIGSDAAESDTTSAADGSPRKKKKRGPPPSRLPGAIETRMQLIPKRNKKNAGEKMRPGRKSFNELRELYRLKLLDVYNTVSEYTVDGRRLAEPFMFRPDPHLYPDYYTEIENPLDMTMIRHRIESGEYDTSEDFTDDFRLLFRNARRYNREDSQIYFDAKQLEQLVINTIMAITNNTVLKNYPPSKRTPHYYSKPEMGSPPRSVPQTPQQSTSNSIAKGKTPIEKGTPSRSQPSPLQIKMIEILDRINDFQNANGRVLSTIFQRLPSKTEYPDYYDVIKKPMDLQKIRQKINGNQYTSQKTFIADLKLVFDNATKYNEPESEIYKDALMLKNEVMEVCAEDHDDDDKPSVQVQVRRILTNLLVAVNTHTNRSRCLSDSFADVTDLFKKNGIPVHEMPFTLDQIKMNLDKGRYKRLDRFQDDVFVLFTKIRQLSRPESQMFLDSIDLQKVFISKRDDLCKGILVSPASTFTESGLWDEVEARKKAAKREKSPSTTENDVESDADRSKESEKTSETEKSKDVAEEIIDNAEYDGVTYTSNQFVYVASSKENSQEDPNQWHILRIERIVRDGEGADGILVKGIWIYRPRETFYLATRKFYEKEVFITTEHHSVTLSRLRGKCCVLYLDDYLRVKPKEFNDQDVFVCEYKYLGRRGHFKRLNAWPYAEETKLLEMEDRPEDFNPQKTVIAKYEEREQTATPTQNDPIDDPTDDDNDDERMRDLPNVLDVHREEVPFNRRPTANTQDEMETDEASKTESEVVYYEQVNLNGAYYRIGDCVFVFNPRKPYCDVMRIDRIWQTPDGQRHFSGMFFARPIELNRGPNATFFKREVIAVEQRDRAELLERIQGRCAVLPTKQFNICRPTEVPECDVFVVDKIVSGDPRDESTYMVASTAKLCRKWKTYNWTDAVPDDEIFYFKKPIEMERRPEPLEPKVDAMLPCALEDIDTEETIITEQVENPVTAKDNSWLASQPKLNAKSKSGYILFSAEIRKRIQHENPEAGFGDVSKLVGVEWKKLNEEQKKQYEVRATLIAEERTKQSTNGPNKKLQPGEIRVFICRWHGCDYQFDHYDGLFDHLRTSHASADETKVQEGNDTHFMCLWMTCVKYRANGKPFPTLNRLLRHIREKHMPSSGKVINLTQRAKHFFHYIPQEQPVRDNNPQGMFVAQPNGKVIPSIVPSRTAIPWDPKALPSAPNSPIHPPVPGTPTSVLPSHTSAHHTPNSSAPQVYHVQPASQSAAPAGATQVVQVVNGSSVAYMNSPYQTVIVNQQGQHHQVMTSTGQATGQILVQHAVGHPSTPHQIVVHGTPSSTAQINGIQPGQGYASHATPGSVHVYASSSTATSVAHPTANGLTYYTTQGQPATHYTVPVSSVHSTTTQLNPTDASKTIVSAQPRPEPLFVPPPNSIKVKHVLHSEVYVRYIESLSQARQRTVSRYDHNLQRNPQMSNAVEKRKLPIDWIDKESYGKRREEEVVKALWKLRDGLYEDTLGIRRDTEPI